MYDDDFSDLPDTGKSSDHDNGYSNDSQGGGYQKGGYGGGQGGGYQKGGYGGNGGGNGGQGGGYQKNNYGGGQGGGYQKGGYGGNGGGGYQKGGYGGGQGGGFKKAGSKAPDMKELYKPYLIAGSGEFPTNKTAELRSIVELLDKHAFTARVNGMRGLGVVSEELVKQTRNELHIPWSGFDDKESKFGWAHPFASELLLQLNPAAEKLSAGVQKMMTTYIRMMLGKDMNSPVLFAVVYSPDCAEKPNEKTNDTGSIDTILSLAFTYRRPVFNLAKPDCEKRIRHYLSIAE